MKHMPPSPPPAAALQRGAAGARRHAPAGSFSDSCLCSGSRRVAAKLKLWGGGQIRGHSDTALFFDSASTQAESNRS